MRKGHTGRGPRLTVMALAAVLAAGGWPSAQAVSFQSSSGDWTGSWDTTIGYGQAWRVSGLDCRLVAIADGGCGYSPKDRKSTRLNSSHLVISYAVFCLKKKKIRSTGV